jgi:hypothetical protein
MHESTDGPEIAANRGFDEELAAMTEVARVLAKLDPNAQGRVLDWISSRLAVTVRPHRSSERAVAQSDEAGTSGEREVSVPRSGPSDFQYPAELFDAARPKTDTEKALVLAYWFQACQAQISFSSRQVNDELKHIGYGVSNITRALDALSTTRPALVIQIEKSGKTQQAQKKFKMTHEGIKRVQQLLATTVEDK